MNERQRREAMIQRRCDRDYRLEVLKIVCQAIVAIAAAVVAAIMASNK